MNGYILSIIQDLVYTVLFLVCVAVSCFALQQPKAKQWLAEATLLVKAVVFVAVAALGSSCLCYDRVGEKEKKMNLAIFGGTGRTGRLLVEKALSAGHTVTLLARDPSKVEAQDADLVVVAGDIQDAVRVGQVIDGADAVLSVLGPTNNKRPYEISAGMENLLAAMKEKNVRRLIVTVGAGVRDPQDRPTLLDRLFGFMVKVFAYHVYRDMAQTADTVRASDLDWTLVRIPMLTDDAPTGNVQVGYVGRGVGRKITRADLADFLLDQVADCTYVQWAPAISN